MADTSESRGALNKYILFFVLGFNCEFSRNCQELDEQNDDAQNDVNYT